MHQKLRPVEQFAIDLRQRLGVVLGQFDPLPEFGGLVGSLDAFEVEVQDAGGRVGAHGGVAGVGERAGLSAAEAGDVVFVAAEVLLLGGSGMLLVGVDWDF